MSKLSRSVLYLPASSPRALAKSRSLNCDAVILDLEDAVAPEEKSAARIAAVAAGKEGGFGDRRLIVRVNGLETEWGADDLSAIADAGFDAVLAPKVSTPEDVHRYAGLIGPGAELWIMIETCRAVFQVEALAASATTSPLTTFVFGSNDLVKEMRVVLTPARTPLLAFLSVAVAAARLHGLTMLDGVFNGLDDPDGLTAACAQSVEFGCDGRTLIHPGQIAICNAAFTPSDDQVSRARAIVSAFEQPDNHGKGALRVDGAMVERLHLAEARRTVSLARECSERDGRLGAGAGR